MKLVQKLDRFVRLDDNTKPLMPSWYNEVACAKTARWDVFTIERWRAGNLASMLPHLDGAKAYYRRVKNPERDGVEFEWYTLNGIAIAWRETGTGEDWYYNANLLDAWEFT